MSEIRLEIEGELSSGPHRNKKIEPGRFAEGPRSPGLSCPPPQCASKKLVTAEKFQAWNSQQWGTTSACQIFVTPRNCATLPPFSREKVKPPT